MKVSHSRLVDRGPVNWKITNEIDKNRRWVPKQYVSFKARPRGVPKTTINMGGSHRRKKVKITLAKGF